MFDDMYRVCRWCHWFNNGKCCKGGIVDMEESFPEVLTVYGVAESGKLSETLEESLGSADRSEFKGQLRDELVKLKVSEKKIKDFLQVFDECMGQFLDFTVKPLLDDDVSRLYQTQIEDIADATGVANEVVIKDPEDFYCKYFE